MGERGKAILAILANGKKGKKDEEDGESGDKPNDGEMAAAEQLAALLGIDDDKVEAFAEALHDFVANCVADEDY